MPSKGKISDLFYSGNSELSLLDWEQIVHALVTYGNVIWINSNSLISSKIDPILSTAIEQTLEELKESKLVLTWDLEASANSKVVVDRIVTIEEHKNLYESINFAILGDGDREISVGPSDENIERTSRLIEYRQELWHLGIASFCNAYGIVYRTSPSKRLIPSSYYRYEMLNKQYTQQLFKKFKIESMWSLSAEDIITLRKRASKLRAKIDSLLAGKIHEIGVPSERISSECERLYSEYLECVNDMLREKTNLGTVKGTTKDTIVGAAGLILPIVGVYPIAERFWLWLKNKEQYGFVLYMLELQEKTYQAARSKKQVR